MPDTRSLPEALPIRSNEATRDTGRTRTEYDEKKHTHIVDKWMIKEWVAYGIGVCVCEVNLNEPTEIEI